ncbi:MAG: hypothetical protein A2X86_15695 [Bdellovibrionales bacterium GWA2_49_15]|nr:MAG: hypothetical protein A2X86_15695 [Bdellovibrionales bacterium GWA2_49_15]HAZ14574.1 hypothetical protein [Bdellovibrionales bacterium]
MRLNFERNDQVLMLKILKDSERLVIFRLGKFLRTAGPGMVVLIPMIDRGHKFDLRPMKMQVEAHNQIIDVEFKIDDPLKRALTMIGEENENQNLKAIVTQYLDNYKQARGSVLRLQASSTFNQEILQEINENFSPKGISIIKFSSR